MMILGREHHAAATRLTIRAAIAVAAAAAALFGLLLCLSLPVIVFLPIIYAAAEVVFLIIYIYRYLTLSVQPVKHKPRLSYDPQEQFYKVMHHVGQHGDMREFITIWFHGAPLHTIRRGNLADLLAYAFFFETQDDLAAEGRSDELQHMVQYMMDTWALQLQPGYNKELRWMCHLWEPMRHWYRPLAFYLFMELATLLCRIGLQAAGFQRTTWMGVTYYKTNMHTSAQQQQQQQQGPLEPAAVPLVLLHGIGMGLIPYIGLLFNMAATGRPVLVLEFPHVAMRWVLWVPTMDELAEVFVSIMRREALDSCCLVAHSYGSAVASRLLQQHPAKIRQLCLIDPICFAMFMPNLLRNFLYESPRTGNPLGDLMMMAAARDLHVAASLSRHFFWTDINLWQEDLPADSLVVLSGRDALMAAQQVKAWLELNTAAVVMYHPNLAHAGCLLDLAWQQQVLQQALQLLDKGGSGGSSSGGDPGSQKQGQRGQQDKHLSSSSGPTSPSSSTTTTGSPPFVCSSTPTTTSNSSRPDSFELVEPAAATASAIATASAASAHEELKITEASDFVGSQITAVGPLATGAAATAVVPGAASLCHSLCSAGKSSTSTSTSSSTSCHSSLQGGMRESSSSHRSSCAGSSLADDTGATTAIDPMQQQVELLTSWSGVLPAAALAPPARSCPVAPSCSSMSSAAAALDAESPKTFFSACSSNSSSWQDFAAVAASREATLAAHVLLQPL